MTSSKKSFPSSRKGKVKGAKAGQPESAEEYLEAGVESEEAGEKWRAGDSTKSLRFFVKAMDQYDAGLRAFPTSVDLAYNKARLQYEITQQPRLLEQIPESRTDLLKSARASHVFASQLDGSNTDVLFNLGQVCASLAECVLEGHGETESQKAEASQFLRQALDVLQQCLRIQEQQFETESMPTQDTESVVDDVSHAADGENSMSQQTEEVWASVIEPLTEDLFDTCLAIFEALKLLSQILTTNKGDFDLVEIIFSSNIRERLQLYGQKSGREWQSVIALASLLSAYAELRFRVGAMDISTFDDQVSGALALIQNVPQLEASAEGLVALGEIHLDYDSAMESHFELNASPQLPVSSLNRSRWEHITRALESFTAASKLPDVANLARIHIARGDCELLRTRLGDQPCNYDFAMKTHETLIKNADIYYQAARRVLSNNRPSSADDASEVEVKIAIIALFQTDDAQILSALLKKNSVKLKQCVADCAQQGLFGEQMSSKLRQVLEG